MGGFLRMLLLSFLFWMKLSLCRAQDEALDRRVRRLQELSSRNPAINMNDERFRSLIEAYPRNYTVILLLTANAANRRCEPCKYAFDEFQIIAGSWRFSQQREGTDKLFFAVADFDETPEIFRKLNQNTAPSLYCVLPKGNILSAARMDTHNGLSADAMTGWIYTQTGIQVRVLRPPNYTAVLLLVVFMGIGAAALWFGRIDISIFYTSSVWRGLSLVFIYFGISGQVYNQIRGPPLMHPSPSGELMLIYGGSNFQFVAETFIVMLLYIAVTAGVIFINRVAETSEPGKKKVYVLTGVALFCIAFSMLLSIFRKKYVGYPFSFLLR